MYKKDNVVLDSGYENDYETELDEESGNEKDEAEYQEIELPNFIIAKGKVKGKFFEGLFEDKHYKNVVYRGTAYEWEPYDGEAYSLEIGDFILHGKYKEFIFTGTKQNKKGEIREGTFNLDDELECEFGRIIYENGEIDEGVFEADTLVEGSYFNPKQNSKYIGKFKDQAFIEGVIEQDDVPVFDGTLIGKVHKEIPFNGKTNGFTWKNKKWTGKITNGVFEGELEYIKTGTIKKGKFYNMFQLKEGELIFGENSKNVGIFENATKVKGNWTSDGYFDTENGTITYPNGFYKEGHFRNNLLVDGKLTMNYNVVYEGSFEDKMPYKGKAHNLLLGSYVFTGDFKGHEFEGSIKNCAGFKKGTFSYDSKNKQLTNVSIK